VSRIHGLCVQPIHMFIDTELGHLCAGLLVFLDVTSDSQGHTVVSISPGHVNAWWALISTAPSRLGHARAVYSFRGFPGAPVRHLYLHPMATRTERWRFAMAARTPSLRVFSLRLAWNFSRERNPWHSRSNLQAIAGIPLWTGATPLGLIPIYRCRLGGECLGKQLQPFCGRSPGELSSALPAR